jgi:hypothetical protein
VLLPLLFVTGCQQQSAYAIDPSSRLREACTGGDPNACKALSDMSHGSSARASSEVRAAQIQKDVAAIIRGMRRNTD